MTNWPLKIAIPLLLAGACKSPGNQLIDEFNKVNDSLIRENKTSDKRNIYYLTCSTIMLRTRENPNKHPEWADRVLGIYAETNAVLGMIDSLRTSYRQDFSDSLKNSLSRAVDRYYAALPDTTREKALDFILQPAKISLFHWEKQDSTMLEYLDHSCLEAATLVLKEMNDKF